MPRIAARTDERLVLTLTVDGRDVGLLVAYPWGEGLFLEHVVTFPQAPPFTLAALFTAGLEEAQRRDAQYLGIYQPSTGVDPRLRTVAQRYGFTETKRVRGGRYLVKYAEAA